MNPPSGSLLFRRAAALLAGAVLLCGSGAATVRAQDRLELKNGPPQAGRIVGMNNGNVLIEVATTTGNGQVSFNLSQVSRVVMPAPAAFGAGVAAYQAGQWDQALADLRPLTETFRGLPTEWAQQAAGMLGDLYVEKKDFAKAEAAYNDDRLLYPSGAGGPLRVSVGLARIALARGNAAQAKQSLQGIARAALKNPALVAQAEGAAYGQAFYLLGQIQEQEHSDQEALEDYLRAAVLFNQDAVVAARSQASADALRAAHRGLTAP